MVHLVVSIHVSEVFDSQVAFLLIQFFTSTATALQHYSEQVRSIIVVGKYKFPILVWMLLAPLTHAG